MIQSIKLIIRYVLKKLVEIHFIYLAQKIKLNIIKLNLFLHPRACLRIVNIAMNMFYKVFKSQYIDFKLYIKEKKKS